MESRFSSRQPQPVRSRFRLRSAPATVRRRRSCSIPPADNTDVYAFTARSAEDAITVASNWIPGQVPANGPNFFRFDDRARYYVQHRQQRRRRRRHLVPVHVRHRVRNPNSFLYAGPGTTTCTTRLNVIQRYDLVREKYRHGKAQVGRRRSARTPGRATEHRAEDIPELPGDFVGRGDPDAERRHESCSSGSATIRSTSTSGRRSTRSTCASGHREQGPGEGRLLGIRPPRSSSSSPSGR